jgi:hypothetical protein
VSVRRRHIASSEMNAALRELEQQRDVVQRLSDSERKFELLERIDTMIEDASCGPECSFCGDASFSGSDEPDEITDPLIDSIAKQFQIIPNMNKKVIAGVLIVSAVVLVVIGIKMWRKAQPSKAE